MDIENKYYNAKQMKGDNPEEAITEFLGLPALEQEKGDWSVLFFTCFCKYLYGFWQGLQRPKASHQIGVQIGAVQ